MKKLLVGLFVLALAALGGGGAFLEHAASAPGPSVASQEFTVPKGASAKAVGTRLIDAGLVDSHLAWRWMVFRRGGLSAKAGRHALAAGLSPRQIAEALEAPPLPEDVPFTIVEGWRLRETDDALVA